jgi:hypothetical protein
MCFRRISDYKKAETDIICYKVMKLDDKNRLHSLIWRNYKSYRLGSKIKAHKKLSWFRKRNVKLINTLSELNGEVVHSFTTANVNVSACDNPIVAVECVIPKGEYYWENKDDVEYASLSLKIIQIL